MHACTPVSERTRVYTHVSRILFITQTASVCIQTPTSATINSTDYTNGVFYLDIDSTHPDGDYSCFLQKRLSPLQCVDSSSPLRGSATVSVSNSHLRLLTLETKLQTLTAQYSQLAQQSGLLGPQMALLESSNARLTQQLQELQHNQTALQSLNQQLRQQVACSALVQCRGSAVMWCYSSVGLV